MAGNEAKGRGRACAGLSLLDVTVAMALLTIALCGITGSIVASGGLEKTNRETALAEAGVRGMLEKLNGVPFASVFPLYDSTATDDPAGPGAPGANFAVAGLQAAPGDPDGQPGEIVFPTVGAGPTLQLREDVVVPELGMPRDLNGDGVIDALDHSADYRILPVQVRVRWVGARGVRVVTAETILCAR
jgi:hypothetical protein